MSQTAHHQPSTPGSPDAVLAAARAHQASVRAGEVGILSAAVEWASMHEPVEDGAAAYWWESGQMIPLAGPGAPEVAEFAVAEFAAA